MSFIPSPQATGNAGPSYEQHVGASCLAILLVGGMTPFSSGSTLKEVCFQARRLGWRTDDLLLVGEDPQGTRRRIAIQAKLTFALAKSDEECVKTLRAAWDDFTNAALFHEAHDRLVLVTGQAPMNFTRGMRNLLDAAHAALDAASFSDRIAKYLSKEARNCHEMVTAILRTHAGEAINAEAVWRFLRVWDFAVLDFRSPSSVAEGLVKSLLAATANEPATRATDTWNALLHLTSEQPGRGKDFNWGTLPTELRERHRMPAAAERETFDALRMASDFIRQDVVGHLAGKGGRVALSRAQVVTDAIALLNETTALVITGPAGCGKSVIASKLFDALAPGTFTMAFRADTLAMPHLATSVLSVGVNPRPLIRLFALHERKLLWIERGERLFETSLPGRAAFTDLLRLLSHEQGWKLLITCRDYSAEKFRTIFLDPVGLNSAVLTVPALSDPELEEAAAKLPELRVPLAEPTLREVLRNPFYLKLAARMTWVEGAPHASTRKAFREKAWKEVICREDEAADGMPLERDRAMIEVARRRARALVPYVAVEELPAAAIHALVFDSLLAPNPDDPTAQFAPAHDVYEDWALLQWLRRLREEKGGINAAFFAELGTFPALGRAFRLWLLELFDAERAAAEQCVLAVMSDATLPAHWRDETLVAVFQCPEASRTLRQLAPHLLAGDGDLLRRAVHLLRVACRKKPYGMGTPEGTKPVLVPDGTAWEAMPLVLVGAERLLRVEDIFWLLGFLEDLANGAREHAHPPGAREVAALCKVLLSCTEHVNDPYKEAYRERVIRVMLSVPRAAESALRSMVDKALSQPDDEEEEDGVVLKLIWNHFSGATVCRELPDLVIRVVEQRLCLNETLDPGRTEFQGGSWSNDVEKVFGLDHLWPTDCYPESAWQGPFLNLLTHHPERGVNLMLRLVNRCCTAYANAGGNIIEPPFQTTLTLEDGSTVHQWANGRLWGLYRGSSVGPNVLKSALMALEAWLLEKGTRGDADLPEVFTRLLRESNNVAITAVLVSIGLASSYLLGKTAVPLLTCPCFFDAELSRAMSDQRGSLEELLPDPDPDNKALRWERVESAKKAHRRFNLEDLAVMLQMTSARPLVEALFKRYQEDLPPEIQQTDEDRVWRLRLHRMDVRNFVPAGQMEDGRVLFQSGPPSAELEVFRQRDLPAHQDREHRTWLFLWGVNVFEGRDLEKFRPEEWKGKLTAARTLPAEEDPAVPHLLRPSGVPQIAAVCVRDHWEDMAEDERAWCAETLCREIERLPELSLLATGMLGASEGVNPAAQLLPALLARVRNPNLRVRAKRALVAALLHPERHIAQAAANGMGAYLFDADRVFTLSCVQALLDWARESAAFRATQRRLPWGHRQREEDFDRDLRGRLCASLEQEIPFDESALLAADFLRYPAMHVMMPLLGIFGRAHTDSVARRLHVHLAQVLLTAWQSDRQRRRHLHDEDESKEVELRYMERHHLSEALARFALVCPEDTARALLVPLATAAHKHPEEAARFVKDLAYMEDHHPSEGRFWVLWQLFADVVLAPDVAVKADDDNFHTSTLLDALFLGISWKAETREWRPLTNQSDRLVNFFRQLPPSANNLSSFSKLAARFQSELVPKSLPALSEKLASLPHRALLPRATMESLENILEPLIFSGATEIRRNPELRKAVLSLLNMLVDAGSSAAFKMRDDFLTPLRS